MIRLGVLTFCLCNALGSLTVHTQEKRAGQLAIEPYTFRTYDGRQHQAELGRLWVSENRQGPSNRLIQIAFVRFKSTATKPSAPIVFLAGGPGIPGIGLGQVPVYFNLFERLREVSDVILLDQRGAGLSIPNLQCPASTIPPDLFETKEKALRALSESVRACANHWRTQEVDLGGYHSNSSADDLDDLRQALGADRLSLLAWSYGAEVALAAIRRHGERLERVVMASTRGPDNLIKLPSVWDLHLRRISNLAAEDATVKGFASDIESLIARVLSKLEQNPVTITIIDRRTKDPVKLRVGKIGLQTLVRGDLSDSRAVAGLPALIYTIDQGDYSILTRRMEQLYNGFGLSAMGIAVDCAAGWSPGRMVRATREAKTALMSNVNLQWDPEICKLSGSADLGRDFRSSIKTRVRTLFVSGTLDPNSPPSQAEDVRRGFSNSAHVIVENAGHESLPATEIQNVVVDFFKGQDVGGRKVSFPVPRFLSVEEAKSPPPGRR